MAGKLMSRGSICVNICHNWPVRIMPAFNMAWASRQYRFMTALQFGQFFNLCLVGFGTHS